VSQARAQRKLPAERVRFRANVRELGIRSTDDLEASTALGDPRGAHSLDLALGMRELGYHAFVCGLEGPDRLDRAAAAVRALLRREAPSPDCVYVHDFSDANRPRALRLPAGRGRELRAELAALIRGLREDLPQAFREEAFDREKAELVESYEAHQRSQQQQLEKLAEEASFGLVFTPERNVVLIPMVDGKPVRGEADLRFLGPEKAKKLNDARRELTRKIREHLEAHRLERHRLDEQIHRIEREFAERIARGRARELAGRFQDEKLTHHLEELVDHVLDNLDAFRDEAGAASLPLSIFGGEAPDPFAVYEANVVVDNSKTSSPPVIVVDSPTYKNLFGSIDRTVDRFGRISTDFRRIHAGALLEADGGVAVFNAEDALVEPFVWRILRRALRSGRVEIEAYDPFVGFTPSGIRPEPVRVETKVVLVGPRWLFEMLLALDEEFRDLFKVLADFSPVVERNEESTRSLCGRVVAAVASEGLLPFDASALDALVELAVREADDRRKISVGSERVIDAAREASARASARGRSKATREDVLDAVRDRVYRLDRIEQAIREAITRGILLVDVDGERIGTVNSLAVSDIGGLRFGRPGRVTASVGIGSEGVVSVDRETKLSGPAHDKGVLILQGFLRDRFSRVRPLSLAAAIAFEQSYGQIEGDSASLAELLALLSSIARFPLRQDLAVTGSVNQAGNVQAVGGVNEKVEGFFDCCRARGLSGRQGVVLPAANEEHLLLRDDVADAIEQGRFHLYPISSIDEALSLLAGRPAGSAVDAGTLYYEIDQALDELSRRLQRFSREG
jgi:predicted ATP-dependent protease